MLVPSFHKFLFRNVLLAHRRLATLLDCRASYAGEVCGSDQQVSFNVGDPGCPSVLMAHLQRAPIERVSHMMGQDNKEK